MSSCSRFVIFFGTTALVSGRNGIFRNARLRSEGNGAFREFAGHSPTHHEFRTLEINRNRQKLNYIGLIRRDFLN